MDQALESLDLVPARMINEYVYCPRLAFIEWIEGEFRDNKYTVEGKLAHRRVDREGGRAPETATVDAGKEQPGRAGEAMPEYGWGGEAAKDDASVETEKIHARSLYLSADVLGIVARMDLVEADGKRATPVDYKRGSPAHVSGGVHEPERVQLCAQALVLEENGFECPEGVIYFTGARRRVPVPITDALRARTIGAVNDLRAMARSGQLPPVLDSDPKCFGCSLAGVCLPDEVDLLCKVGKKQSPRRLFPARDDALPLHVQSQWGKVGVSGDSLQIKLKDEKPVEARLRDVSMVSVYGNVQLTTQAIRKLCQAAKPVCFFSFGGWFYGILQGLPNGNSLLRRHQFAAAAEPDRCLHIARSIVNQKIRNQRTLIRRNNKSASGQALQLLKEMARKAKRAAALDELLGLEGTAARAYFGQFEGMIRPPRDPLIFRVNGRNRRPPRDPVNALLSFTYALLVKELTITCSAVGLDPFVGFYHQGRAGRPSLALDLMEPFRPLIADSVVIGAINNGIVRASDFTTRVGAVRLGQAGRKRFIQAYERRMDELVTHPVFGYRISYRRVLEVQARLLGRLLSGELQEYPSFVTR